MIKTFMPNRLKASDDNLLEELRLRSLMFACSIVTAVALCWFAVGIFIGQPIMVVLSGFLGASVVAAYVVTNRGYGFLGKLIWYFSAWFMITSAFFIAPDGSDVEFLYVTMIAGPFLVFSSTSGRRPILSLLTLTGLTWIFVEYVGSGFLGGPYVPGDLAIKIKYGVYVTTFIIIATELLLFGYVTEVYHAELSKSKNAAIDASKAKSDFLASMSHEIRTPMNGIVGMMEILDNSDLSAEQNRLLTTARRSSFALLRIIDDILDVSKIEAGKLEILLEPTNLLRQTESVVEVMRSYADEKNCVLRFFFDPSLPETILTDGGRLGQITLNLLSNAIKFSNRPDDDKQGEAVLWIKRESKDHFVIEVGDNGVGMSDSFLAEMFEPFSQSMDQAAHFKGGTGLGLTIVKRLVDKLDGRIDVSSTLGKGTTIRIHLPMADPIPSKRAPDLDGYTVHIWPTNDAWKAGIETYIAATNATVVWHDTFESQRKTALGNPEKTIFLTSIDMPDSENAFKSDPDFRKIKLVALTNKRIYNSGSASENQIILHSKPTLLSDLYGALSVLSDSKEIVSEGLENVSTPSNFKYLANPEPSLAKKKARAKGLPNARRKRGLVVEDNEVNQTVLVAQLRSLGYETHVAANGAEGLAAFEAGDFDFVLTDFHMPVMSGFEMSQKIREVEDQKGGQTRIPIIAITADAISGDTQRGKNHGMDAFLTKPVRMLDLGAIITRFTADTNS